MTLATFIRSYAPRIVAEWVDFASTLRPFSRSTDPATLQDAVVAMLREVADDMEEPESAREAFVKSRGQSDATANQPNAAWAHGIERLESGLDIKQVVAEFRALRAVVVRLFKERELQCPEPEEIVRLDEAIDQATAETLDAYTKELDRLRNTLLAILAHDLRGPLQAILISSEAVAWKVQDQGKVKPFMDRIKNSAYRMRDLIDDFLTFVRPTLGGEIPIARENLDMAELCRHICGEVRATLHANRIHFQSAGNTRGRWDRSRSEQVISNLLRNAVDHGAKDRSITVMVNGDAGGVAVSVHNYGKPIPPDAMHEIFKPLVQLGNSENGKREHLGLGLYIAKELVERQGGTMDVESSADAGTTFHAFFPRTD